jgi:hypothetical protein
MPPTSCEINRRPQIDLPALGGSRRPACKTCLDWSVRRSHLAGSLGATVRTLFYELNRAKREKGNRVMTFYRNALCA